MENQKLRKRDRVLNVFKAGAKELTKVFKKTRIKQGKPIVNPRNALLGFLVISI